MGGTPHYPTPPTDQVSFTPAAPSGRPPAPSNPSLQATMASTKGLNAGSQPPGAFKNTTLGAAGTILGS